MENLLEVKNLQFSFRTYGGVVKAVRDVSFEVRPGEILGIVGESGCGKSVTSQCLMRLNPEPPGFFEGGEILYKGKDVLKMNKKELRQFRGKEIPTILRISSAFAFFSAALIPFLPTNTSSICFPIRIVGFNEVIGS